MNKNENYLLRSLMSKLPELYLGWLALGGKVGGAIGFSNARKVYRSNRRPEVFPEEILCGIIAGVAIAMIPPLLEREKTD